MNIDKGLIIFHLMVFIRPCLAVECGHGPPRLSITGTMMGLGGVAGVGGTAH